MTAGQFVRARASRRFDVTPDRVYAAWLDPAKIRDWFGPGLGPMVRIDVDARVGGRYSWVQRRGEQDVEHVGEFLAMDPPRRLAFTFAVPPDPSSRVVVDIVESGPGRSEATVTHEIPAEWAAFVPKSVEAWSKMLEAMASTV
jgi:uncharacterized protein YndB with AHSA1/START domain